MARSMAIPEHIRGYESDIVFRCHKCNRVNSSTIPVPETTWTGDKADDRFTQDEECIKCTNCGEEYLLYIQNADGTIFVSVEGHPEVAVKASAARMAGDWSDWYDDLDRVPDDPQSIFIESLMDVRSVAEEIDAAHFGTTLARMVLVQQFSVLEAYLADTLTNQVLKNADVLLKAVKEVKELKEEKVTLAQVAIDQDIVAKIVATHLREFLYHNFKKVMEIWKVTLGHSIFPDKDLTSRMFKAAEIRHDCVHRNGKTKEGEKHDIDSAFVKQVDEDIYAMMEHIEFELAKTGDDSGEKK